MTENLFGYKYDDKKKKYIVDEEEKPIVESVYDLSANFFLDLNEIKWLLFTKDTLNDIVLVRLESLFTQLENEEPDSMFKYLQIDSSILLNSVESSENDWQEKVIKTLTSLQKELLENHTELSESVENRIENIIFLVEHYDEIVSKYNDFHEIKEFIKNMNTKRRDLNSFVFTGSFNQVIKNKHIIHCEHSPIIDKETFDKISKVMKSHLQEEQERDL